MTNASTSAVGPRTRTMRSRGAARSPPRPAPTRRPARSTRARFRRIVAARRRPRDRRAYVRRGGARRRRHARRRHRGARAWDGRGVSARPKSCRRHRETGRESGADVQRRVEALDDGHGAGLITPRRPSRRARARSHAETAEMSCHKDFCRQRGIVRHPPAQTMGYREHPLAHRSARDHAVGHRRREVAHATADAAWAKSAPLAREPNRARPAAVRTPREGEAMRQDAAAQEGLHFRHDERRQRGRIAVGLQVGKEGPPMGLQGLVEQCLFGATALAGLGDPARMNRPRAERRRRSDVGRSRLRHQLRFSGEMRRRFRPRDISGISAGISRVSGTRPTSAGGRRLAHASREFAAPAGRSTANSPQRR